MWKRVWGAGASCVKKIAKEGGLGHLEVTSFPSPFFWSPMKMSRLVSALFFLVLLACTGLWSGCDLGGSGGGGDATLTLTDEQAADLQAALNEYQANPNVAGTNSSSTASTPAATPAPSEASNESEAFFRSVRWLRKDPAAPKARVTKTLSNVSVSSRGVSFRMSDISNWPNQGDRGDLYGIMCLAVVRDGVWTGGKFDHVRRDTTFRDFKNVGSYLPVRPVSGEPVRFWIANYTATEASNYVETRWP